MGEYLKPTETTRYVHTSSNPHTAVTETTEKTISTENTGPIERGVNAAGIIIGIVGGTVASFINPELGAAVAGVGVGVVVGGLAVGTAIRIGNG